MSDFAIKGQLKLDGTEFTGTLRLSNEELKKFGDAGKKAGEGLRAAGDAADRAGGQTAKFRKEVADTGNVTRELVTRVGQLFAAYKLIDITKQVDVYQSLKDRLRAVTENTTQFTVAYRELLKTANATGTSLETNIQLFQRMRLAGKDIGATTAEMLAFNKAVQQLGVISGASTEALQAGTLQLGQALSSSIVHAEEFNSVMENIPAVGVKIAEAMGKTPGQLRQAVINGEVLSRDVFSALLKQSASIGAEFEKMPIRLGRATQDLKNSLLDTLSKLDESVGLTRGVAGAMEDLAKDMRSVGVAIVGLTAASALPALLTLIPKVRAAWIALNIVVAANPFVILASAIAGVTAAIIAWRASMTDGEKLQELLEMPQSSQRGYLRKEIEALQKKANEAAADKSLKDLAEYFENLRESLTIKFSSDDVGLAAGIDEMAQRIAQRHLEIIAFNKKVTDSFTRQSEEVLKNKEAVVSFMADQEDEITLLNLLAAGNKDAAEETRLMSPVVEQLREIYKGNTAALDEHIAALGQLVQAHLEAKRSAEYWESTERDVMEMLKQSVEDAGAKTEDFFKKMKENAQRGATDWGGIWHHAMENMVDVLADGFAQGKLTLQDFFRSVRQIAAQIAAALVFRPVMGSVLGGFAGMGVPGAADAATGMGFSGAGATGAGAGMYAAASGWLNSAGAAIGFSPGAVDMAAVGGSGMVPVAGTMTTATLGATLGAAGLGAMAGNMLADPLGLNKTNTTIGAGAGAAIGMMVGGPWGAAAGALIGLMAGLFGPGESNKTEGYQFNPLSGSNTQVGNMPGSAKYSQQNLQNANTFMTGITGLVQGISSATGAKYTGGKIGVDTGTRDGTNVFFYDAGGGGNYATMDEAVRATIARVTTMFEGLPKDVETAFNSIDWSGDIQENLKLVQFAASFQDNIKAMEAGTLSIQESAYTSAKTQVESYVAQIKDFKETTAKLGLDTEAADNATRSFVERIVGLKETIDQGSPIHQALETIRGTFAAIGPLLTEVGMDANQAATLMNQAIAKLQASFTTGVQGQLNDVMGNGFLNQIAQAVTAHTQNRSDATDLGLDTGLVDKLFTETVRSIIRNGMLTVDQLNLISTTFKDIPEVVAAATEALNGMNGTTLAAADAWSQMNEAEGRGFLNQIATAISAHTAGVAGANGQTLEWVNRTFSATLANIINSGTLTVEQLQLIAATFSGFPEVVADANAAMHGANATFKAANDNLKTQITDLAKAQMDAVSIQIDAQKELVSNATKVAQDMRQAAFNLSIDPRRGSAKSQIENILLPTYDRLVAQAQGGDMGAAGQLQSVGTALVNAAEKAYGTTGPFQAIASRVEKGYLSVANVADQQVTIATAQLNVLNAQLVELQKLTASAGSSAAATRTTTDADFNALNQGFSQSVKDSGLSLADYTKTASFGVYQQALLQDIAGYSGVSKLQSDLAIHQAQSSDPVLGASSQVVAGAIKDRLHELGVPGYAKGGWDWGGLRFVGEQGMELQAGGPARFYSTSDTRSLLAGAMNDNAGLGTKIDTLIGHAAEGNAIAAQILAITRTQAATIQAQAKTIAKQDAELRELRLQRRAS